MYKVQGLEISFFYSINDLNKGKVFSANLE